MDAGGEAMLRAVVVDDEPDLRLLARLMLTDNAEVELVGEAGTGIEALELIRDALPDIAIVDVHLPDMSGVELIALLRGRSCRMRLVAYSSDDVALAAAMRAGADSAVLKSGRSDELLAALVA